MNNIISYNLTIPITTKHTYKRGDINHMSFSLGFIGFGEAAYNMKISIVNSDDPDNTKGRAVNGTRHKRF